jgi:RNA-directed DNA polymerase
VLKTGRRTAEWVLDADISGCFDEISKDWLVANIPMDKAILQKWLNSGYMQDGKWFETRAGTPQGGKCAAAHFPPNEQCWVMHSDRL